MTHLPFIAAAYGIALLSLTGLSVLTWVQYRARARELAKLSADES